MIASERRFADFLDAQGKTWKAQPKTFQIGNERYRPDFYCYDDNMYYEVKTCCTWRGMNKVRAFRKFYPELKIKMVNPDGLPFYRRSMALYLVQLKKVTDLLFSKDITELTPSEIKYLKKYAPRIRGIRAPLFARAKSGPWRGGKNPMVAYAAPAVKEDSL